MSALLSAELLKLRTTRTFLVLAGLAAGLSMLLAGLAAGLTDRDTDKILTEVFAADLSSIFVLILAVVGITGEWRHRTITSSLLAAPDRVRFLAAKTLAYAAAGLLLSLLVALAVSIVGFTIVLIRDLPSPDLGDLLSLYARNAGVTMLLGALGVGIGAIVRNQAVAIVVVLVAAFVVEPAFVALLPDAGQFGPLTVLPTALSDTSESNSGYDPAVLIAPGYAALAMLAWIAVFFAAGAALLRARDVD
jgi:ABC-2 type transport system permease protein